MYLPNRYFTESFTSSERYPLLEKYAGPEWQFINRFVNDRRNRISKSAVHISEVMEAKLNIKLFPLIVPVACKGFGIGGGTAAFMMFGPNNTEYLFGDRAAYYKSKTATYTIDISHFQTWIYRQH